jgi:hydroxyethylthiazole kinase-like uncharacterized protein yjeF
MQKVFTAAEMREVDRLTTERYGIPSIILMENAAHAVAKVITDKLGGSVKGKSILILCGKGNNGGDGAAVARILWVEGARVTVLVNGHIEETKGDAFTNFSILKYFSQQSRLRLYELTSREMMLNWWSQNRAEFQFDVIVDAVFGTGLSRPLDDESISFLELARDYTIDYFPSHVVAVDIPSGLNADHGQGYGYVFEAGTTVTFTSHKPATVLPPSVGECGEVVLAHIGSPATLTLATGPGLYVSDVFDARTWLWKSPFANNSYKNKRGHALIIAGSENYAGAATLCGNAAIRSGVGLVTIGTPRSSKDLVGGRVVPEVMVRPLAETESGAISEKAIADIEKFSKNIDAIAIGAGLSANDESTGRFVRHFVENRTIPTLLDADALTLLSPFQRVSTPHVSKGSDGDEAAGPKLDPPVILTPHEGEFMRLLGTDDKEAIEDRVGAVRKFAQEKNVILVLKGERVLIGGPGGKVVVNPTGNSGLGKAGNGDTLLGILAGFAAQAAAMEIDMFETIVAGVYIAALAGDIAAEKFGKRVMTASDTRDCLAEAFRRCEGKTNN